MKHTKRIFNNKNQTEFFGLVWLTDDTHPHRLRAGDVIRFDNRLCRVMRVNDCSAVVVMNQPPRQFETRFRGPVTFQPSPKARQQTRLALILGTKFEDATTG